MFSFASARRSPFTLRKVAAVIAAVATAGLLTMGVSAPAFATAPTPGTFNLTLETSTAIAEDDPGAPVQNAQVDMLHFNADEGTWDQFTTAQTNSSGRLDTSIGGLTPGDEYAVFVNANQAIDANNSTPITDSNGWLAQQGSQMVSDFDSTPGDDASILTYFTATSGARDKVENLAAGIGLAGNVYDQAGTTTETADSFTFYRLTNQPDGGASWEPYKTDSQAGTSYNVSGLAPGTYVVKASQSENPSLAPVTYNFGSNSFDSAAPVQLDYSPTPVTQDVWFDNAATISGTVNLTPGFTPVDGVVANVFAYPLDSSSNTDENPGEQIEADVSADDGSYSMAVPPGNYDVEFVPVGFAASYSPTLYPSWYNGAPYSQSAQHVNVSSAGDNATGIDGTIGSGLEISGIVHSSGGAPLAGIEVDMVSQSSESEVGSTLTNGDGYYDMIVPPDYYNLEFSDPNGVWPARFYNGSQDGTPNIALGTTISQQNGSLEADFTYDSYQSLTVHVANKAGSSLAGVNIYATPMADGSAIPNADVIPSGTVTGHAGTYELDGLQVGTQYALQFWPQANSGAYTQYWGGSTNAETSKLYTPDGDNTSLDITLASSAALSGVVANAANHAIGGVQVVLYAFDGLIWNEYTSVVTSSSGKYSFPNLPNGSYTVRFETPGNSSYISAWAGGGTSPATASHVYVAQGKPATINQHLSTGGSIVGVVAASGGTLKLAHIAVVPIALTGTPGSFTAATVDTDSFATSVTGGKFTLSGLPTGYYALSFSDDSGTPTYGNPYASPVGDPSSTTPVYHVVAGHVTTVSGTIQLPLLSDTITGEIDGSLDTSGVPTFGEAAGIVEIDDSSGNTVDTEMLQTDGTFQSFLVPGDYTYTAIIFDPQNPTNRFDQQTGPISVPDGVVQLVIPVVAADPLAFTNVPDIQSDLGDVVGTTYSMGDVSSNHTGAALSYQWMRCGDNNCSDPGSGDWTPIYGATGPTYKARGDDVGEAIALRLTLTDSYLNPVPTDYVDEKTVQYVVATTELGLSLDMYNTVSPTTNFDAAGKVAIGQTIKATPGNWNNVPGITYHYRWVVDGGPDDGSLLPSDSSPDLTPTFVPTAAEADAGYAVRLYVRAESDGYSDQSGYVPDSTSILILPFKAPTLKIAPKITKTVLGGNQVKYSVTPGTWSVSGTTPSYVWNEEDGTSTPQQVSTTNSVTISTGSEPIPYLTLTVSANKSGYNPGVWNTVVQKSDGNVDLIGGLGGLHNSVVGDVNTWSNNVPVGSTLSIPSSDGWLFSDDSSPATNVTYQWVRQIANFSKNPSNITGATKSTYVVTTADIGYHILLEAFPSSPTHVAGSYTFLGGTGELRQDLVTSPATVTASSANTNAPLTKITDTVGAWGSTTSVTNHYQWLICTDGTCSDPTTADYTSISGATSSSYTPTLAQATDSIVLKVTGSKSNYANGTAYGPVTPLGNGTTITNVTKPTIASGLSSGNATFGVKLTGKPGTFDVPGVTITYDWQVSTDGGNTWIDDPFASNMSTYTPALGDFANEYDHIRLKVTASKALFTTDAVAYSAAAPLVGAVPTPTVKPTLTTTSTNWTVSSGTWPSSGGVGSPTYTWFVNNTSQPNPGNSNLFDRTSVTAADYVFVSVEWSGGAAYKPAYYLITLQKGVAPIWNAPTISGTPQYGNTLSVSSTLSDDYTYPDELNSGAHLTYQWYSNGAAISHATSSTFTPSTSYINHTISVRVIATSQNYATGSNLTAGVHFVAGPAQHGAPTIRFTGTVHSGGSVGVNLTGYSVTGLSHSYQWQLSKDDATWSNISGATKSTYTVSPSYLGDYLRVLVGSSKSGYASTSDYTEVEQIVQPKALAPMSAPALNGTGLVGSVLTVSPGTWNVTGTTFTYQWYRDSVIIPGATSSTFTPTADEWREPVSVAIIAHASGYNPVTVVPNVVYIEDGAAPTAIVKPKITGTAAEGSTLTVTPGTWSVDGLTISYQWYYGTGDGTAIDGATSNTFTPDLLELAQPVFCKVTVDRTGYQEGEAQSQSTALVAT